MRTCWRCGVDFDAEKYVESAPCEDCQLDVEGYWLKGWSRGKQTPEENDRRASIIMAEWKLGLNDAMIAEKYGIHPSTVGDWRKKLGLEPNWQTNRFDPIKEADRSSKRAYKNRLWEYSPVNKPGAFSGRRRSEGRRFN